MIYFSRIGVGSDCLLCWEKNVLLPKVAAVSHRRRPLVLKLGRRSDAQWKPFELHLARCCAWPSGADDALKTGRSRIPEGASAGYSDQWDV